MPTISEKVQIKGNERVNLRLAIGDGQIGGYSMLLESKELTPVSSGASHAEYDLGPGEELRYCLLIGTVKVQDVNPTTNRTAVTVTVKQGATERTFKDQEMASTGGIVNYGLAISFV